MYPEFPHIDNFVPVKRTQNVWRQWLEDTQDDAVTSFNIDRQESDEFLIARYIKDADDAR